MELDADDKSIYYVNCSKHRDYHSHNDGYADNGPALHTDRDGGHEHLGPAVDCQCERQQIGVLQIATWALVGIVAFLLAYLLSGQRTR